MDALVLMLIMGASLGVIIGLAAKFFAVRHDPRIEQVEEMLPGTNCGACGFAGCADFARALVSGEATPELCPSSSSESVHRIADFLGVEAGALNRMVAVVRCGGDDRAAQWAAGYNGVRDCRSASLVAGGAKGCVYGCLGMGTCSRVCPFGAIEMRDGLAIVHPDICTGCRKCVAVCPRQLIIMAPADAPVHIFCNSPAKGGAKSKVCKVSCIGCRKCYKEAGEEKIRMEGFLARINYDCPPDPEIVKVCPTGCLQTAGAMAAKSESEVA